MNDNVNNPSHYTAGPVECLDAMIAAFGREAVNNFAVCNAFKYIFRHEHKGGREDLLKAIFYLRLATGDDPRETRAHKSKDIAKTVDSDMAAYEQRLEGYRAQHGVKE